MHPLLKRKQMVWELAERTTWHLDYIESLATGELEDMMTYRNLKIEYENEQLEAAAIRQRQQQLLNGVNTSFRPK